jgi:squalene-hopene/tetraprenyl-beta-curcumene cyclase
MMSHVLGVFACASTVVAGEAAPGPRKAAGLEPLPAELRGRVEASIGRGLEFLAATQRPDGGWKGLLESDPAITSLAAKCFNQHPKYGRNHPIVKSAIERVLTYRQKDGGIYPDGIGLRNYYTSVCLMMLAAADDPKLGQTIQSAQGFLKGLQWDEDEEIQPENSWYGGAGYGKHKRPDLSNTQMMLEALKQSGLPADDPTYRKALKFIERCQMSSETNDQAFAREAHEGGFIYTPVNGGESKAGTIRIQGREQLRCYGSMTYAGFKSMLHADLDRKDPRIRRALDWISRHYTLDVNPNMPGRQSREGLYYYYHVFARALQAWGEPRLADHMGVKHDWRSDLCRKLLSLQHGDGSWTNAEDRWHEGNPVYVTALAVLALQTVLGQGVSPAS